MYTQTDSMMIENSLYYLLQTRRKFSKGDFVLEYSGELIDIGSAKDRESRYSLDTTIGSYMYYFNHKDKSYW